MVYKCSPEAAVLRQNGSTLALTPDNQQMRVLVYYKNLTDVWQVGQQPASSRGPLKGQWSLSQYCTESDAPGSLGAAWPQARPSGFSRGSSR